MIGIKPTKMFDLLVAGEINPDLILSGDVAPVFNQVEKLVDSAEITIGSSSVIFACGAARLGLKVAFVGLCGNDLFGQFMLSEMRKHDINVEHVIIRDKGSTGLSVILNRQADRAILTFMGLMDALSAENISDQLLAQCRHLHVASYFLQTRLQPELPGLFQRAHRLGLSTSLDSNYDPSEKWSGLANVLPHCDVFLPNEREALAITRAHELPFAGRALAAQTGGVAVKRGADGAVAFQNNQSWQADSLAVTVIDTIGAGDSFDAGYLYGYLQHWPIERSLRLACVCGSLSTQQRGGTAGQPTLLEAMQYVPE